MRNFFTFLLLSALVFVSIDTAVLAAEPTAAKSTPISIYEQPDAKAKIIATIPAGQAIIPIYMQGDWQKVADPSNGNVGWVKSETLKQQGIPTIKTEARSLNNPNGSGYQIMQFSSGMQPFDTKHLQQLMLEWQNRQNNVQRSFNQVINQNMADFNALVRALNEQSPIMIPVLQPVIIMPQSSAPAAEPKK